MWLTHKLNNSSLEYMSLSPTELKEMVTPVILSSIFYLSHYSKVERYLATANTAITIAERSMEDALLVQSLFTFYKGWSGYGLGMEQGLNMLKVCILQNIDILQLISVCRTDQKPTIQSSPTNFQWSGY